MKQQINKRNPHGSGIFTSGAFSHTRQNQQKSLVKIFSDKI